MTAEDLKDVELSDLDDVPGLKAVQKRKFGRLLSRLKPQLPAFVPSVASTQAVFSPPPPALSDVAFTPPPVPAVAPKVTPPPPVPGLATAHVTAGSPQQQAALADALCRLDALRVGMIFGLVPSCCCEVWHSLVTFSGRGCTEANRMG